MENNNNNNPGVKKSPQTHSVCVKRWFHTQLWLIHKSRHVHFLHFTYTGLKV